MVKIYEDFDTDTHYLGHLTKLKHSNTLEYFITTFEHLTFKREDLSNVFIRELFINGLKDEIHA